MHFGRTRGRPSRDLKRTPKTGAAGRQESMADLRGDLAELIRAVRALGRVAEQGRRG